MKMNYSREYALSKLSRFGIIEKEGLLIILKSRATEIGIKTWGIIDFLKMPWRKK